MTPTKFDRSLAVAGLGFAAWFALSLAGPLTAQTIYPYKIHDSLGPDRAVAGGPAFQVTPDGSRVVYVADRDTNDVNELYSVPIDGGTPVKLNDPLVAGGGVDSFDVSPDGSRVVYLADQEFNDRFELYSVPVSGGPAVKLNGSLVPNGDVEDFEVSSDGSRVVYLADQDTDGKSELYSVPVDGGTPRKLNGPIGGSVGTIVGRGFAISPNSSRVVYGADDKLFSVPIGGGVAVKLNGPLVLGGGVKEFFVSPDSSRVVYVADQDTVSVSELFSVPLGGGTEVKLHGDLPADRDAFGVEISEDSRFVVYRSNQDSIDVVELYSVPLEGGTPEKLNGTLVSGGDVQWTAQISAEAGLVVYPADQDSDNVSELYSVAIDGGTAVRLNGTLVSGGNVRDFQLSADGSYVIYRADQDTDEVAELYHVPSEGGTAVKISGDLAPGEEVSAFSLSPDGNRVTYLVDEGVAGASLYTVAVTGGTPVRLSGDLAPGGNVAGDFQWSPSGNLLVYRADQDLDEVFELFAGKAQTSWETIGGSWFAGENWRDGAIPDETVEALITIPAWVQVAAQDVPAEAELLVLGGGIGSSVLELQDGAALHLPGGAVLQAGAVLRGDGVFSVGALPLALPNGAELRAAEGDRLRTQSGPVANAGSIEAAGRVPHPAEVEFAGPVINLPGTGSITGFEAVLRFQEGLQNNGSVSFGGGTNEVRGDVSNAPGGLITVSGGGTTIFSDDVANDGFINVSASGALQSVAVFFGALSGNGVSGGGHVFLEGDTRPGASPGTMQFGGEVSLGPFAELTIELGGGAAGTDYDQVQVAGHLELGGVLSVALLEDFVPRAGMVFDLWEAGSGSGQFASMELPPLPIGRFWRSEHLNTTGELRVASVPLTYAEFAAFYGLSGTPADDQNRNGIANLFEYVTGRNPVASESGSALLSITPNVAEDRIEFVLASPAASDVVLELETSTTLQDGGPGGWEVIATRTGIGPWRGSAPVGLTPEGELERITVTNANGDAERFYRLTATLKP